MKGRLKYEVDLTFGRIENKKSCTKIKGNNDDKKDEEENEGSSKCQVRDGERE